MRANIIKIGMAALFIFGMSSNMAYAQKREATAEEKTRIDSIFQKYVAANATKNKDVLVNMFGYAPFQVDNFTDKPLWHYNNYTLIKGIVENENGKVKFSAFYIVSKENQDEKIVLVVHGDYSDNENTAFIGSWQTWPADSENDSYTMQKAMEEIEMWFSMDLK